MVRKRLLLVLLLLVLGAASLFAQAPHPSATLNWNASPDAGVSYNLYRSTTSGSGYVLVNPTPTSSLTLTDTAVVVGGTYFYVVRATVGGLESANSNEVKAVILPAAPTNLKVVVN